MSLVVDIKKKLKGFSLEVAFETDEDYVGILGASGSGKSMTLKCIAGIETPDEGRIILNGKVLFDSEKKINLKPQDRNAGYLFQNYALFPHMTVQENIGIGLKLSKKEKEQKINKLLEIFHLQGLEKKYPNQISGGQQQRVALARCMVYKPDILMLDEPFSALDSHLKEQLQSGVLELLKLYHGEVLMVSHSMDEIYRFCKKIIIVDKGRSVLFGNTKEIFEQPQLHTAARLTGCKNISRCKVLSSHHVHAVDWNITLETEKTVLEKIKYIGIREYDFQIINSAKAKEQKNVIECRINKKVEDVVEYNVFFENNESKKENGNASILYKINKDKWDNREEKEILYLKVPQDAILLLE
ncbi:ATP-binding cassette domain-containing protein [Clostridium swellfunianum]|uniref:sulfate/molybdate ABC transporter ATP-binding protein n=1 Tax=Clostridium swellfunianum TaxID=1367462 RepID=UPI00202FC87A|nr:ATP-binding cassette domain-containing protein [Clostridium swellfunianum]MCM0650521.1 ATP-binding cassette domain-containing protein [Clostridium swellfunianum]